MEVTVDTKENRNSITKVTEEFADSTAIHAIPHIFKTTNRVFRVLWTLITLVSFGEWMLQFISST